MSEEFRPSPNNNTKDGTPCLAKVISVVDQTYNGVLEVQLLREVGGDEGAAAQIRTVKYLSPFYGVTSYDYVGEDPDTHDETQKSYGFWMIPPDVGSYVVCIFLNGDEKKGYWIGCPLINENINFSTPGFASTEFIVSDSRATDTEKTRVPGTEYNKKIHDGNEDGTKKLKPEHPLAKFLENQGLLKDDIRGITSSSARRDIPSMVFGISTPGPIDKQGKTGKVGKSEFEINNAFVSRLGGSSFVMDDGDDKWEREKLPTDGPPIYKNVEENQTGLRDRPHNELIRLRTRTGHQILLHNSEDLIYIGNSRGTAWIEITSDGKIDIFSEDNINIRTKQDFNLFCDRDFNVEVKRNMNLKVHGEMHTNVKKDQVLIVDRDQKIHIKGRRDETIDEQYRQTVNDDVKKFYLTDYSHNIDGRTDVRIAKGVSVTAGKGASGAQFAPWESTRQKPEDPMSTDEETSSPVEDQNGPTPDSIDIKIYKNMRIEHIGNVDHTIDGYLRTKIKDAVQINTDSTWQHTSSGHIDVKTDGHIFHTSAGSNETNAGGNIIETAPQIHMNGPTAGTAPTADIASLPEEARITAKATIPLNLKMHKLPDLSAQDKWQSLEELITILRRIPTYEPYVHHESLEPKRFKPDPVEDYKGLDRDEEDRYHPVSDDTPTESLATPASHWRKYTTTIDTFQRNPPIENNTNDEGSWGL
jgi:hypothetical protein